MPKDFPEEWWSRISLGFDSDFVKHVNATYTRRMQQDE